MATNKTLALMTACASLFIASCASTHHATETIPEAGLTVSELYHQSVKQQAAPLPIKRTVQPVVLKAPQQAFKALPNPEIPLYVFPHVAQIGDEQLIKPGYTVQFFLYKQNQFALASELY
jgi:conjugative transfer region lipoprotein (TIGR03751 family)